MLETLRRTRAGAIAEQRRKKGTSLRSEMSSHFPSRKVSETSDKSKQSVAHGSISLCVCLTINRIKSLLMMFEAGLGEKVVEFDKLDMKAEEF